VDDPLPLDTSEVYALQTKLLGWYDQHHRDLPWRVDRDPYRVWVSEVMLQQTRVAAVLDHYARWMRKFPTVQTLAASREGSVLAAWSGLGYYHRARRIHQAARLIVHMRDGQFPQSAEQWQSLPGIGRYTAAAVASIVLGEAVAVVDGNVERVLTRMFGSTETKGAIWHRAEALLSPRRPGDFNQAMMELGATTCTPRAPRCLLCPLLPWCETRGDASRKPATARKRREIHYAFAQRGDSVLLVQRAPDASLMAGMWELPLLSDEARNGAATLARFRHSITDTNYAISVSKVSAKQLRGSGIGARWASRRQWKHLPLTGLARKILWRLMPEAQHVRRERSD